MTKLFTATPLYANGDTGADINIAALDAVDGATSVKQALRATGAEPPKSIVMTTVEPSTVTNVDYDTLAVTFAG